MNKKHLQAVIHHSTAGFVVVDDSNRILFANPAAQLLLNAASNLLVDNALTLPEPVDADTSVTHQTVANRTLELSHTPIEWDDAPARLICITDITRYGNQSDIRESDAQRDEALLSLGRLILEGGSLSDLRHAVIEIVRDTLAVDLVAVFSYNTEKHTAPLAVGTDRHGKHIDQLSLPANRASHVGKVLLDRDIVVVDDWCREKRFADATVRAYGVVSSLTVALPHADGGDNTPWGALSVYTVEARQFTDWDVNFMHRVALVLAYATQREHLMSREDNANMLLKAAGRAARIGGWESDRETGRIIWSDEVAAIHDLPPQTMVMNRAESHSYVTEEYSDISLEGMAGLLNDGVSLDREIKVRTAKGREIWVRLIGEPVFDDAGHVVRARGAIQDITAQKEARSEIDFLAFRDPLTELPNRRLLKEQLNEAIRVCQRSGEKAAVMLLDLDDFKILNDTLGHAHGDQLLQLVAQRLIGIQRDGDVVARFGGDEFVLLVRRLDGDGHKAAAQVEAIGQSILDVLKQPYHLGQTEYHSRQSMGITLFGFQNDDATELLKQADLTMYEAKARGRGQICIYDPEMQELIKARATLERDIRRGIQEDEFRPYFQPQVDDDGRIIGAEVLARWFHPQRGMISPAEFIPLAEDSGLIQDLGGIMLTHACQQLARWAGEPSTAHLHLAVNVSAQQFHHPEFVQNIQWVIDDSGADPENLVLELTETSVLDNIDDTIAKMTALGRIGITFSLDDFGTGYSSLYYLKRLPLAQLKIDKSFVRNADRDVDNGMIVRTVVALAGAMQLDCIAEGVETQAEHEFLAKLNCRRYQGYLFGRPQPIEQFQARLEVANNHD